MHWRIKTIWGLILLCSAFITIHLYQIQLQGYTYARAAFAMGGQEVVLEQFTRGDITDRNGVSLTGSAYANRVVVVPVLMDDRERWLLQLAELLSEDYEQLANLAKEGAFYIDRTLSENELQKLEQAKLPGVVMLPVYYRYGVRPLAVHITGQMGKIVSLAEYEKLVDAGSKSYLFGDWVGRSGLEFFYEQELKGTLAKNWAQAPVDALGRLIQGPGLLVNTKDSDPGCLNVMTTLDVKVQEIVEEVMDCYIADGAVVVMEAGSGDILAMASRPAYSPHQLNNIYFEELTADIFVNHATALFHPGSVFKLVLAAAAIEEDALLAGDSFICQGAVAEPIRCWESAGHGVLSFEQAFANSCNPAFVSIGEAMGAEQIIKYSAVLGLDKQEIIGYPSDSDTRQDLSLIAKTYNLASSSVGQGPVLVTPVQVTALLNCIASGGNFYTPRLVRGLSDDNGRIVQTISGSQPKQVISPASAAKLAELLKLVTTFGVGQKASRNDVKSAGKTGSAQAGYGDDLVDAWFAGYVSADSPQYVITVLVRGGKSGGDTAAPIFNEIAVKCQALSGQH